MFVYTHSIHKHILPTLFSFMSVESSLALPLASARNRHIQQKQGTGGLESAPAAAVSVVGEREKGVQTLG